MPVKHAWRRVVLVVACVFGTGGCATWMSSQTHDAQPEQPGAHAGHELRLACPAGATMEPPPPLTLGEPRVFPLETAQAGAGALYLVRLNWSWPALAPDRGWQRVRLSVSTTTATILDFYPRGSQTPQAIAGALKADAQQRLQVVPRGAGGVPIEPWTLPISGRVYGSWAMWSVTARPREALPPGGGAVYLLVYANPGSSHLELRVRPRATIGPLVFGRLRSGCTADIADQVLSIALGPPTSATAPTETLALGAPALRGRATRAAIAPQAPRERRRPAH